MDELERELLRNFLAKNKYPEFIDNPLVPIPINPDLLSKFNRIEVLERDSKTNNRKLTNLDYLVLGWYYLGWNDKHICDLKKSEFYGEQIKGVGGVIISLMTYLKLKNMTYRTFRERYVKLIGKLTKLDIKSSDVFLYRILKLLSGLMNENYEYELGDDLNKLSEFDTKNLSPLDIDCFINKWVSQDRKGELIFIRYMIGPTNNKLEYLLGRTGTTNNAHKNSELNKKLNLVKRV